MIGDISRANHIYVACGHTDMRKSIDGLVACVQQSFQLNPFSDSLFLFCGRRRDRIKALLWEGDGATASAIVFSIIETAKENGLNPYAYLTYIFKNAPNWDIRNNVNSLQRLMPNVVPVYCKTNAVTK